MSDQIAHMYLYSLRDGTSTCVSCPSSATIVPTPTDSGRLDYDGFRPRYLSNDGKVFFSAVGGLVPQDINGVADFYEYDGQTKEVELAELG